MKNNLVTVMITDVENFKDFCPSTTSIGLGAYFFLSRELTFKKRKGKDEFEIWYTSLPIPPPDNFKGIGLTISNFFVYSFHALGFIIFSLYVIYITCVPEKWRFGVKDTNMFRPYTFEKGSVNDLPGDE
jgi:hypothetical protein